jgi:hypothetical protein
VHPTPRWILAAPAIRAKAIVAKAIVAPALAAALLATSMPAQAATTSYVCTDATTENRYPISVDFDPDTHALALENAAWRVEGVATTVFTDKRYGSKTYKLGGGYTVSSVTIQYDGTLTIGDGRWHCNERSRP